MNGDYRPASQHDAELMGKHKAGEVIEFVKVRRNRNGRQHAKFFVLLQFVLENQDRYTNLEHLKQDIKLKAGYFETHLNYYRHPETGDWAERVIKYPKSMSYASMNREEFEKFYDDCLQVIMDTFYPDMQRAELENEFLSFWSNWRG